MFIKTEDKILTDAKQISEHMNNFYVHIANQTRGDVNISQDFGESNQDCIQRCPDYFDSHQSVQNIGKQSKTFSVSLTQL